MGCSSRHAPDTISEVQWHEASLMLKYEAAITHCIADQRDRDMDCYGVASGVHACSMPSALQQVRTGPTAAASYLQHSLVEEFLSIRVHEQLIKVIRDASAILNAADHVAHSLPGGCGCLLCIHLQQMVLQVQYTDISNVSAGLAPCISTCTPDHSTCWQCAMQLH